MSFQGLAPGGRLTSCVIESLNGPQVTGPETGRPSGGFGLTGEAKAIAVLERMVAVTAVPDLGR